MQDVVTDGWRRMASIGAGGPKILSRRMAGDGCHPKFCCDGWLEMDAIQNFVVTDGLKWMASIGDPQLKKNC